jgi:hypothetical protein
MQQYKLLSPLRLRSPATLTAALALARHRLSPLAGGQYKSLYFRRSERRSFSDPIADAIILG